MWNKGDIMKRMVVSLLALLVLVGCSTSKDTQKVRFVLDWTPNTNHTGLYVALEKGYFEEVGIALEIVQPPEDGAVGLVAANGAEFGVGFQDTLASVWARPEPLPVTAVAAMIQHNTSGIVSLKDKGIDRPSKMANHTYATWDIPVEQAILKYVMEQDGGSFDSVALIPNTVTDAVSALQSNIDAIWIYRGWDGIALDVAQQEINYFAFADYAKELDFYSPVVIANNEYLKENPDQAKAFLAALGKGYQDAVANPEEAAQILMKHVPELKSNEALIVESQKYLAGEYMRGEAQWGKFDANRWNAFYNWLGEKQLIEQPIPAGFGFTNEFLAS